MEVVEDVGLITSERCVLPDSSWKVIAEVVEDVGLITCERMENRHGVILSLCEGAAV